MEGLANDMEGRTRTMGRLDAFYLGGEKNDLGIIGWKRLLSQRCGG